MMSPQEVDALRKELKHKMVELGLDRPGSLITLADRMNVNRNSLSMALTGLREGGPSVALLERLRQVLDAWPQGEGI
jgi:transcriptional regulator with XRE-family HTH domain